MANDPVVSNGKVSQDDAENPGPREVRGYFVQIPLQRPEDRLDLRVIWRHIVRHRLMISLSIIVPVVLSAIVVSIMRPVYQSNVLLVPAATEDSTSSLSALTGGLASIVGIATPPGSKKEQTIAILQSRAFTEAFIKSENLMPILFEDQWDPGVKKWKATIRGRIPTIADGVELFEDDIRMINDDASTNLVTLQIEWYDRELAARWANLMVERLNQDVRRREIGEAQRSIEFLARELEKSGTVELRQGISDLMRQQLERIMLANVRQDFAFKVLDPAVAADADDYVWPNKLAIILSCGVLGLFLGIVAVALRLSWQTTN